jgi:hypothetical protein
VAGIAQPAVDPQRDVDEGRVLHVEADEVAVPRGLCDEPLDVRVAEPLVERDADVGELEGDVRPQLLGLDPVEHVFVRADDGFGLLGVANVLAEQGRVRPQPLLVQPAERDDGLVQRLAGDEARGAEPHPVLADEALDVPAVGGCQDQLPEH